MTFRGSHPKRVRLPRGRAEPAAVACHSRPQEKSTRGRELRGRGVRGETRLGEGANRTFAALPQKAARCRQLRATAETVDFCSDFLFPLSQEGVASHCRDMECPKDETAIAQALYKLSVPPRAGAPRRGKHGTPRPAGAFPRNKAAHCPLRVHCERLMKNPACLLTPCQNSAIIQILTPCQNETRGEQNAESLKGAYRIAHGRDC